MVGARSLAMALNRLIDAGIDARNPRTAGRELPSGRAAAVAGARLLPASRSPSSSSPSGSSIPIVRWLWPIPVAALRRLPVPEAIHLALPSLARRGRRARAGRRVGRDHRRAAVAGVGARRRRGALGGRLRPLLLALRPGDRSRAGAALVGRALRRARSRSSRRAVCHVRHGRAARRRRARARRSALSTGSAWQWWRRCSLYEHALVRPDDLRRLDAAFFTMNGVISVAVLRLRAPGRARVIRAPQPRQALRRQAGARGARPRRPARRLRVVTGPNGSGKTTLLRLCAGLARAHARASSTVDVDRATDRLPRRTSRSSTAS